MASRLANLLVNIPKRKGQCYQAVSKLLPDRKSTARKSARSCCRFPRTRSSSAVDHTSHVRSYSQPAMRRRRNCLAGEHVSRRHKSDQMEHSEETEEADEARAAEDNRTFYYDAPDKDRRLYESARELSSQERMIAVNQSQMARKEVSEPESVQYELEATRPREPVQMYDVIEHFATMYKTRDQRMVPHLQPSNLRPFGSTNTLISPTLIKSANKITYPVYDTHEAHSASAVGRSSERDTDDMQRRGFSTYKSVRAKENPGYRPTNKMSQLVKHKERAVEESEEIACSSKTVEPSAELKKCNELIEKQRELNAKYYAQKNIETAAERKPVNTTSAFVEKYRFPKTASSKTSIAEPSLRKKFEIGKKKAANAGTSAQQRKECKREDVSAASEQNLSWPEREVQQTPAAVRSTLPINMLQSTASPEDCRIREKVTLGPNQKLAVPWPAYSERMVPKKMRSLNVVYPALSSTGVMKPPLKGDCLDARSHIQTRGICTDNNFRIDGGLFSNDCRLRHVLCKTEVVDSILQKSNAFKENLCSSKIGSISRDFSSARHSSTLTKKFTSKRPVHNRRRKRVVCKVAINKNRYRRKNLPDMKASDCPCVKPKPLKDMKIKKLRRRYELAEKPRICVEEDICAETSRSDAGLRLKRRQLPVIGTAECPCVERHMTDAPKLKKRTPRPVYEPPKICPKRCEELMTRADQGVRFKRKQLPVLAPSDCPCKEPLPMKEVPSLQRLDLFVPEPKRVCPKRCSEKHARADAGLRLQSRELPRITSGDCPCVEEHIADAPRIKRLIPKPVFPPRRVCPIPCSEKTARADHGMEVEAKSLPSFPASDCPCVEAKPMTDPPPLDRLDLYVPEPRKVCPLPCSKTQLRADAGLRVKPKELPMIEPGDCPCVEHSMKDAPRLKRLVPKPVYEMKKVCVVPCKDQHDRADEGLKITPKELPTLHSEDCPCPRPVRIKDVRPLDRLDLYVPEPKRIRSKKCSETTPRSDRGLQVKSRELPMITPGDCPCVQTHMKDAPKLRRLTPKPVFEPRKICPVPCEKVNPRADQTRRKRKNKSLPTFTPADCPCQEPKPMQDVPPLGRLDLYVSEPKRIRPKTCSELIPRADAYLRVKRKRLPIVDDAECPSPGLNVLKPGAKLTRPKFNSVSEPEKDCEPVDYCSLIPRSDDDDWEYVVPEGCEDQPEYTSAARPSRKPGSSKLQPDFKMRRHFSMFIPHESPTINVSKRSLSNNALDDNQICNFHTQRLSETGSPVFPKSPFKDPVPWTGIVKNSASSTANPNIKHGIMDEPECFFRRPISTSNFMQAMCAGDKKNKQKPKCAKFNLPGCSPQARTSCKKKLVQHKCVRQSSPYPSFSEVSDPDIETMECECTKLDYLQPRHPIIKQVARFELPPPHQGHIDPSIEDTCIRKKLGIPPHAGTAICSATITRKRLKQRDFLDKLRELDEPNEEKDKEKEKEKGEASEPEKVVSDEMCCLTGGDKKQKPKMSPVEKCLEECCKAKRERERLRNMTLWERIVNYFRARPDCPSPEEFKKKMLREKAEKAAAAAGLCLYDPQEMCKVKDLPKIITANDVKNDCKEEKDEDDTCDDVVKVSAEKCKKHAFMCTASEKSSKPDFPKTEAAAEIKTDCEPKKEKQAEKEPADSICDKLKQCMSGGVQKRKYSTDNSKQSAEINYLLNNLIYGDEKTKEYLLTKAAPIIDDLIDQGYSVMEYTRDDGLTSVSTSPYDGRDKTQEDPTPLTTDIDDSNEATESH